jgi:hypothetical protein
VVGLAWSRDPESYTGSSVATARASNARQVKGNGTHQKGYPGPPGWGLGVGLKTLPPKSITVTQRQTGDQVPPTVVVPMKEAEEEEGLFYLPFSITKKETKTYFIILFSLLYKVVQI